MKKNVKKFGVICLFFVALMGITVYASYKEVRNGRYVIEYDDTVVWSGVFNWDPDLNVKVKDESSINDRKLEVSYTAYDDGIIVKKYTKTNQYLTLVINQTDFVDCADKVVVVHRLYNPKNNLAIITKTNTLRK